MQHLNTDILIVGGSVGGCAAALAACNAGRSVIMTEESDWIGGQLTSQATPPDEHGWIERFGCTASYRSMRNGVREYYRRNYPLTPDASARAFLNPGDGWVSPLCAEPRAFLAVLNDMLADHIDAGRLTIITGAFPVAAETSGDRVLAVSIEDAVSADRTVISADYFLDATELGDLLPLTGTEYVTGSESADESGEPNASKVARPANTQAFSMCFAMSYDEGEDNTIERPATYDFWRSFVPELDPKWSGPLLRLTGISPRTMQPVTYNFAPNREENKAFAGLWTYRRILHRANFHPGFASSDITLVNYPQIDYMLGDLCGTMPGSVTRRELIEAAKEQSLSFLYFLQTELELRGLRIRPDVVGTADGLAKMPYVREARRIRAEYTITEPDVSAAFRPDSITGKEYADSVGIGHYRIDLHPTVGGDNYVDVESLPFQIPLGAMIPVRCDNLLPACKNIGTTHITNGCYRLHPVEWNIGEAAGELAAYCLAKGLTPRQVRNDSSALSDFQLELISRGFELSWPSGLVLAEGDPHAHAR